MKTIGLLGGMSWESTIPYYRIINEFDTTALHARKAAELALVSAQDRR